MHTQKDKLTRATAVLDLVSFYPPALWQPPSAPLHFLSTLREAYVRRTGDPFFSGAHDGQPPWLQAFLAVEGLVQLPLAACFVYDLVSSPRRSSFPRAEVVGVALGALNFMGSAVCCWELHCAPPGVLSAAQKIPLLYGQYLPFAVIRKYPLLREQVEL